MDRGVLICNEPIQPPGTMKNRSVILPLLTATLFASPAFAQSEAPAAPPPAPGPRHAEMIKQFDQNGDGRLDDTERAAARAAHRGEFLKRFDRDGDGQLNDSEKAAARQAGKAMHQKWSRGGGPGDPPPWMRRELHRWFEQKWGGHAGPGRPHGPAFAGGPRGKLHGGILKRFDQNHDGRLDDTERAEAKKAGEEMRAQARARHQDMLSRFDKDGDGKMGEEERKAMREAWEKFIQQYPPLKSAAK